MRHVRLQWQQDLMALTVLEYLFVFLRDLIRFAALSAAMDYISVCLHQHRKQAS